MSRLFLSVSLLIFCLFPFFLEAQTADQLLQTSKEKVESLEDMQARFSYSLSSKSLRPVSRSGELYFKQGQYRISLGSIKLISDKKTLWQVLTEENEVLVQSAEDTDGPRPDEIFRVYQNQGNSRLEGTETVHGISCHKLFISVNSSNLDYDKAYLWIDKKTDLPVKVSLIDRKNTTTTYELFDIKTDSGLQESLFRFNSQDCQGCDMVDY